MRKHNNHTPEAHGKLCPDPCKGKGLCFPCGESGHDYFQGSFGAGVPQGGMERCPHPIVEWKADEGLFCGTLECLERRFDRGSM